MPEPTLIVFIELYKAIFLLFVVYFDADSLMSAIMNGCIRASTQTKNAVRNHKNKQFSAVSNCCTYLIVCCNCMFAIEFEISKQRIVSHNKQHTAQKSLVISCGEKKIHFAAKSSVYVSNACQRSFIDFIDTANSDFSLLQTYYYCTYSYTYIFI